MIREQPFQFIHARTIGQSVKDYPRLMKQAYEYASFSRLSLPLANTQQQPLTRRLDGDA